MKKNIALLALVVSLLAPVTSVSAAKPGSGGGTPTAPFVCLDPGHGGSDPGAIYGGVKESDLNLSVALRVRDLLAQNSVPSALTRTDDSTKSNNDRYTFCNSTAATSLVSVHHNASTNYAVDYTLAMYQQSNSLKLADTVGRAVAAGVNNSDFRTSRYPSGVLIKSTMPSMMSEGYFMSNTQRTITLSDPSTRESLVQAEAQAIVSGLKQYYAIQ